MNYSIDTLKKLKTKEIIEAIKNKEVSEDIIETIAFNKKQPTRKFYNPKIYKAILTTYPEENIAVTILEKLISKEKADILDFYYFLINKNINKEFFNFYLQEAIIRDERILRMINQTDERVESRFLKEIIEKNFERAEILLNKNLDKEDFIKVIKKHIDEEDYQEFATSFNLNEYDENLVIEIAKHSNSVYIFNNILKNTSITETQAEQLKEIIPSNILISALVKEVFKNEEVAKIFFKKVKDEVKDDKTTLIEIFYFYESLIKELYSSREEYFEDVFFKYSNHFKYYPIKVKRELQEKLLEEFRTRASNRKFKDIYKRYYYLENLGTYLVKAGDLDIAREVVKINDKMFESVNFEYLKRENIVITKEDINLLLNNGTPYFTKVIIVDNNELVFDYNQKLILDSLMKKVDKKTKEYILDKFHNLTTDYFYTN